MLGHPPNGAQPGPAPQRLAGLDAGRQALLFELLAALAHHQDPEAVWAVLATRLKCLRNPGAPDGGARDPEPSPPHATR